MFDHIIRQTDIRLCCNGSLGRREFLKWVPAVGAAGTTLSWTDWIAAQAPQLQQHHKRCILLWMQGGPSQFETFSPLEGHAHAGETRSIDTKVPGIRVAENLPESARVMDKVCLIRSVTSKEGSHPRATFLLHTGYLPNPSVRHPAFGSVTAQQLGEAASELPRFVRIGGRNRALPDAGMLGVDFDPFLLANPIQPPENTRPTTEESRFRRRLALVKKANERYARRGAVVESKNQTKLYRAAAKMMLSSEMRAFDLSLEKSAVRDAYGESAFGQGCLMARRLIEAGVAFVEVTLGNWDTHQNNFARSKELCAQLDQPFAQLLTDLDQRQMLRDTLVIWMGEFGRTPRINPRGGRDHYPHAFTVALAGGGVLGGQVIGAVDRTGTDVVETPVSVQDLFQTFCKLLGIDSDHENMAPAGRPIKIVEGGTPVKQVWTAS